MRFRSAGTDDIETLNKISVRSKAYWGYPDEWMEHWMDELTLIAAKFREQSILVVEVKGKIVGFSSLIEAADFYEIYHLWVLPEHIGKGIGKELLRETLKKFVRNDKPVIVEADPNAEPFYRSQGFETYDKVESYPKGRFLPVMKKTIDRSI